MALNAHGGVDGPHLWHEIDFREGCVGVLLLSNLAEGTNWSGSAHVSNYSNRLLVKRVQQSKKQICHLEHLPTNSLSIPVFSDISVAEILLPPVGIASKTPASRSVRMAPVLAA